MSLSKELPKCFVCFQPTVKFGATDDKFLSVVMLLRMEGHLPYPPKGSPVLIKDWDPCEPCVPKTLDLYKEYAKVQENLEGRNGRGRGRRFKERRGEKANVNVVEGGISSKESDDGRNEREHGVKSTESNFVKRSGMNLRKRRFANKRYADFCTTEQEDEASPKKKRRRTNTKDSEEECPGNSFKCPPCPLMLSQKVSVGRHILAVHENNRPFKCPKCPISFTTNYHRQRHITAIHEGGRPFNCPQCLISFSSGQNLQRHIRVVHEGVRDFKCPHCPKSFGQRNKLRDHVAIVHEGRVLYKCPQPNCKSTFTQKQNIKIHVQSVHKERKDFKCPICLKGFSQKATCVKHARVVHGTEAEMENGYE